MFSPRKYTGWMLAVCLSVFSADLLSASESAGPSPDTINERKKQAEAEAAEYAKSLMRRSQRNTVTETSKGRSRPRLYVLKGYIGKQYVEFSTPNYEEYLKEREKWKEIEAKLNAPAIAKQAAEEKRINETLRKLRKTDPAPILLGVIAAAIVVSALIVALWILKGVLVSQEKRRRRRRDEYDTERQDKI